MNLPTLITLLGIASLAARQQIPETMTIAAENLLPNCSVDVIPCFRR